MSTPLEQSVVCPVIVGRAPQVAVLHSLVDEARRGRGTAVLLVGEAGIGKSRLVAEARASAQARGFRVLQGNCFEPDSACPYAPLLDLLRAHFTDPADLGPAASALYPLLPDLIPPPVAPPPILDTEQERRLLFAALVQVLLRLAEQRPLLVIIEDLHWSDDASLELLHLLMRRSTGHPLLLLMTYRGDEAGPGLCHWLAQLDRQRLARELSLAPLGATEVEAMLHAIFAPQQPVGRDFLDAIFALSQGNPFIIEELLKSLVAAGEVVYTGGTWTRRPIARLRIPRSVQDAVQQRRARLGDAARQLVNVAAVAGRRFDVAILQAVIGHDDEHLIDLIKELIAAQLVVEESAERFAFRHALTREAIYDDLLVRERRALHRAVAEAIELRGAAMPEAHLEELAYHYHAAGVWELAFDQARRAAARARALHAPQSVIEQASRALEAAERLGRPPAPDLLRLRGEAHDLSGDFARAEADFEAILHLARATDDRVAEWRALLDLGQLWTGRDYAVARVHLQRALDLARTLDDPAAVAHSLNRLGNWYANAEQPDPSLLHHQEALAIFERLGDRPGIAATLDLLGMGAAIGADHVAATRYAVQSLAIFRELGDRQGAIGGLIGTAFPAIYEANVSVSAGNLAESWVACGQALALAREIGWRSGEVFAQAMFGEILAAQGAYAQALGELRAALALAEEIEHRQWMIQALCGLGGLYIDLLALGQARASYERALLLAREIDSLLWIRDLTGMLASVLVAQGALAEAEAALAGVLDPTTAMRTQGERQLWCARAELALARDDPAEAVVLLDRLYATAANLREEGDIPRLARLKGMALAGLGELVPAERLLRAGLRCAEAEGLAAPRWQLHAALGNLHRRQGRADDAARADGAARRLVEGLAAGVPEEDLREGFTRGALALLSPLSARRAAREVYGGLTAREREVAALIARGHSNREIAATLSVSERTIETHVSNALTKLGFTTRAQIASWATARNLPIR